MGQPLRLLVIEDVDDDFALVVRELRRGGFDVSASRVETAAAMRHALDGESWDVVISDFSLPAFDAPGALALLKSAGLDIPLIIVSGTVNEELAVDSLKAGAGDFIAKSNLARLVPAVRRELRETAMRRQRAAALRDLEASQASYQDLFENSPLPTLIFDTRTFMILKVNAACEVLFRRTRESLLTHTLRAVWPETEVAARIAGIARLPNGLTSIPALTFLRGDGTLASVEVTTYALPFDAKPARLAVLYDLTERRLLEDQLRQAQKMEAVGQLAGGVAHDFNNMLAVITSYAELLRFDIPEGRPERADLDEIVKAAERAAVLTRQLLVFSRRQVLQPTIVDLNVVLANVANILTRTIGADIEFDMSCAGARGMVRADAGQIEQVLMNLVVNARDAMPNGGKLAICTRDVVLDQAYADAHLDVRPGAFVMLSVTDTGTGIDTETLARIFEPFFTTKEVGKGTGLGLSTAYGIVRQSGGHIVVDSEVGRGTTFEIYLPTTEAPVTLIQRTSSTPQSSRSDETVLLVEDEELVRTVAARILRDRGYTVLTASRASDAKRVAAQHTGAIHVLVTDLVMPEASGTQLATELLLSRPTLRVLFMSGYSGLAVIRHRLDPDAVFLEKPFTPDVLVAKLRQALNHAPQQTMSSPRNEFVHDNS